MIWIEFGVCLVTLLSLLPPLARFLWPSISSALHKTSSSSWHNSWYWLKPAGAREARGVVGGVYWGTGGQGAWLLGGERGKMGLGGGACCKCTRFISIHSFGFLNHISPHFWGPFPFACKILYTFTLIRSADRFGVYAAVFRLLVGHLERNLQSRNSFGGRNPNFTHLPRRNKQNFGQNWRVFKRNFRIRI